MPGMNDNATTFTLTVDVNDAQARQKVAQLIRDSSNQVITMNVNANGGSQGVIGHTGGSSGGASSVSATRMSATITPATPGGGSTAPTRPPVAHSGVSMPGIQAALPPASQQGLPIGATTRYRSAAYVGPHPPPPPNITYPYPAGPFPQGITYPSPAGPAVANMAPMSAGRFAQFARGALYATSQAASEELNILTQERLTGRPDQLRSMVAPYQFGGGIIGAGVGSLFGGYGAVIGASAGGSVGSMFGEYLAANNVRDTRLTNSSLPLSSTQLGYQGDGANRMGFDANNIAIDSGREWNGTPRTRKGLLSNPTLSNARRFSRGAQKLQADIHDLVATRARGERGLDPMDDTEFKQYLPTAEDIAAGSNSVYSALITGGYDPEQKIAGDRFDVNGSLELTDTGRSGGLTSKTGRIGARAFYNRVSATMTGPLYSEITKRAMFKYLNGGKDVLEKVVSPILADSQRNGMNVADILSQHGAQNTYDFLNVMSNLYTTPEGQYGVSMKDLQGVQKQVASLDRMGALVSTQVVNKGAGIAAMYNQQANAIDTLPDGNQSLISKQLRQKQRAANMQWFEEEGATSYGLPQAKISGMQSRLNLMPFSPINGIGLAIASSRNANAEGTRMDNWFKQHGSELSEEQRVAWESRRQGMRTQSWEAAAMLSEGLENRLPGLSSNAPAGTGRFSSMNMAAMHMQIIGGFSRAYGASNGRQLKDQNNLFADMGGTPDMGNAKSLTAGYNQSSEMVQLLRQLVANTSGGSREGTRISEASNQLSGQLSRRSDATPGRVN